MHIDLPLDDAAGAVRNYLDKSKDAIKQAAGSSVKLALHGVEQYMQLVC